MLVDTLIRGILRIPFGVQNIVGDWIEMTVHVFLDGCPPSLSVLRFVYA